MEINDIVGALRAYRRFVSCCFYWGRYIDCSVEIEVDVAAKGMIPNIKKFSAKGKTPEGAFRGCFEEIEKELRQRGIELERSLRD